MDIIPESNAENDSSRNDSPHSFMSSSTSKRAPSLRGSAKFKTTHPPANNGSTEQSIEEKMSALSCLFGDQFLITEFPGKNGATKGAHFDVDLSVSGHSDYYDDDDDDMTVSDFPDDGRRSKSDADYETDLDMDYEEWINEEKIQIDNDLTGRKKYIHMCNETGVIPVSYFLKHIDKKEFVMRFHGLGPLGAKAIAFPLKNNRKIEKVNLEGNWIMSEGSTYLAKMLKNNLYVTHLYLAENQIGNEGTDAISEMLMKNDIIFALDLSGNGIEDSGAELLCKMLLKNTTIRHVYLANNKFEERAAYKFREVLCQNEAIETLDLSWNHFRTRGAMAIGEGIQENYGLKCIKLGMNGFGRQGAEALGKALKNNRTLVELSISHNRIPELGAIDIAKGLQTNDCLKTLDMGSNPLGADGPFALLQAISKNDVSSVEVVDLSNVLVTKEFIELTDKLEAERIMTITHGGMVGEVVDMETLTHDPLAEFRRDPMTRLQEYAREAGFRMIDLFKEFDRDGNMAISPQEFIIGIKKAGIRISVRQLEILIDRLDRDKNGMVDYGELVTTDAEHRLKKRELMSRKGKRPSTTDEDSDDDDDDD